MRDTSRWSTYKTIEINTEAEFSDIPYAEPHLVSLSLEAGWLDLLLDFKDDADTLIVFFQGAIDRTKAPFLPNFTGVTLTKNLQASKLFISDPSLYLDKSLRLAWYAGSRYCNVRALINRTVSSFVARLGIKKLIFVGPSGGGYAALWTSSFFPDSLAIVWNPQTDILNYNKTHVEDYAKICFHTTPDLLSSVMETSLAPRYKDGQENYILYLQNSLDWHVTKHMNPFLNTLQLKAYNTVCSMPLSDRFFLYGSKNWGKGHIAPPLELLRKVLDIAVSSHSFKSIFLRSRFAV